MSSKQIGKLFALTSELRSDINHLELKCRVLSVENSKLQDEVERLKAELDRK